MMKEYVYRPNSGWFFLIVALLMVLGGPALLILGAAMLEGGNGLGGYAIGGGVLSILGGIIMLFGFQAVAPNNARVMLLFGAYRGSVTESGFYWVNPFFSKRKISLRVRNFETGTVTTPEKKDASGKVLQHKLRSASRPSKVNDRDGNPIEISAGKHRGGQRPVAARHPRTPG